MDQRHLVTLWTPDHGSNVMEILDAELAARASDPEEIHLYLTDYRSLYVAEIGEITCDDVLKDDRTHVPDYYERNELICDC